MEVNMNPQPHPIVGQLGVLIFALLTAYFCFTGKRKDFQFSDKFTIGYINDDNTCVVVKDNIPKNITRKKKQIPQSLLTPIKEEETIDNQLFEDCVLALVSLGTKKIQSKKIAIDIFKNHNPKTIEDFIKFVYIKNEYIK
jgi:hypothetical protein